MKRENEWEKRERMGRERMNGKRENEWEEGERMGKGRMNGKRENEREKLIGAWPIKVLAEG